MFGSSINAFFFLQHMFWYTMHAAQLCVSTQTCFLGWESDSHPDPIFFVAL